MTIYEQARQVIYELLEQAKLRPGQLVVIGCSTSEVTGHRIGSDSSMATAQQLYDAIAHLNRALILEAEAAEKYGYEPVCVVPQPKAGGSFATTAWQKMQNPVAVEHIRAHCGLDIGGTLIGMHLKDVAVPVRLSLSKIGEANILCARTRPKYIGGERAHYE